MLVCTQQLSRFLFETTNSQSMRKRDIQGLVDRILPQCPSQAALQSAIRSLVREANRQSRLDAQRDPLSKLPMA